MASRLTSIALGVVLTVCVSPPDAIAQGAMPPLVVILTDTGVTRDGLPVFAHHPDERRYRDGLERGYAGHVVRVYRAVQVLRHARRATPIEPAYLVLTDHQGGFPRTGFAIGNERKPDAPYVDLHRRSRLSGTFAAIDQIFPHELLHHLLRQIVGEVPEGGANQVHAIGVRTDPYVAFNEGFAEQAQVLALDDPGAASDTAALARDQDQVRRTDQALQAYRRSLTATWAPATRARMAFVLWFSRGEDVLRYHAVKANRFAFEPDVPDSLLRRRPYDAYLLYSTLPGETSGARKSQGRLRSSEGAVSALFARLVASREVQSRYLPPAFYAPFGLAPADVPPIENAYLKLLHAFDRYSPHDAAAAVRAYLDTFPDEAASVDALARQAGWDPRQASPAEVWLANDAFTTGTTLFDQFRAIPRVHTFDLNAASLVDLLSIEGMTRHAAEAILEGAPYSSLDDLRRVPAVSDDLRNRLAGMAGRMTKLRAEAAEEAVTLSLQSIFMPYLYRAGLWLAVGSIAAALVYRWARPVVWWRAALNGLAAAALGLLAAWTSDAWAGVVVLAVPLAVWGLPAFLWQAIRHRSPVAGGRALAAWMLAAFVPFVLTRAWG